MVELQGMWSVGPQNGQNIGTPFPLANFCSKGAGSKGRKIMSRMVKFLGREKFCISISKFGCSKIGKSSSTTASSSGGSSIDRRAREDP